jgi:hypothetical protein
MTHGVVEDDPVAIAKFLSGSKINLLRPEKLSEYLKNRYSIYSVLIDTNFKVYD